MGILMKYIWCTLRSPWRLHAPYCRRVFTAITKSHPQRNDVFKSDLDKCLPSIQEIQCAFVKVRQICVVGELICKPWLYHHMCNPHVGKWYFTVLTLCRSFRGVRREVVFLRRKLTVAGVCQVGKRLHGAPGWWYSGSLSLCSPHAFICSLKFLCNSCLFFCLFCFHM